MRTPTRASSIVASGPRTAPRASRTEAGSASEALVVLARQPIDLMISDIGMPEMDGMALIRAVDRTRAIQSGFQSHIPKPVDATELLTVAASLVGGLRPSG